MLFNFKDILIFCIFVHICNGCKYNEFTCTSKECIPKEKRCDTKRDCSDGSDEKDCVSHLCQPPLWYPCKSNSQCVSFSMICNNEYDCADLSDERNCSKSTLMAPCSNEQYKCPEGLCIPNKWKCNGIRECLNGEDEQSCDKKCTEFECNDGTCLQSANWKCDGVPDCADKSDELDCGKSTLPQYCTADRHMVLCANDDVCINHSQVCDGIADCDDKSDETLCLSAHTCETRNCPGECTKTKNNNTWCVCEEGYRLEDGSRCKDIDECQYYGTCDQTCQNTHGSYKCSCEINYTLDVDNRTCEANDGSPTLFFADYKQIRGILIRTNMYFAFVSNLAGIVGLSFNGRNIYFTEDVNGNSVISSVRDNGSQYKNLITIGLKLPEDVSVDPVTGNIYFTDSYLRHIAVCGSDVVYCKILINTDNEKPRGLALHPQNGEMYWTEWGSTSKIYKAWMDGTDKKVVLDTDLLWTNGLAIDPILQRLYWVESQTNPRIESAKLDGSDRRIIYKSRLMHPFAIDVFENRVFWTDWNQSSVESCNRFTGLDHTILQKETIEKSPFGIEIYHSIIHDNKFNPCSLGYCSHLCLLKRGTFSCKCPENKVLQPDGHTCADKFGPQRILMATLTKLWIMNYIELGKDNITYIPLSFSNISALAYDSVNDAVIISDSIKKSIISLNLNTFKSETILQDYGFGFISSLDFDYVGNNIYWCDSKKKIVEVLNLNTKSRKVVLKETQGEIPSEILLVPQEGIMFLGIQTLKNEAFVARLHLDGTNKSHTIIKSLEGPIKLSYDEELERVFALDMSTGEIRITSLAGDEDHAFGFPTKHVSGLTFLKRNVFYTKENSSFIFWVDKLKPTSNPVKVFYFSKYDALPISHILSVTPKTIPRHPCSKQNGQCSHICLVGLNQKAFCDCPANMKLGTDNKTCHYPFDCRADQFLCKNSQTCISKALTCDQVRDCPHGEDENDCIRRESVAAIVCPKTFFQCGSGDCIDEALVCDFNFDCPDKSDEFNCETYLNHTITCPTGDFICSDGKCISYGHRCDGKKDCEGGEDEMHCEKSECFDYQFRCKTGACIPHAWECDQEIDCEDKSDEHSNCAYKKCLAPNFLCRNGFCIDEKLKCNQIDDCGDYSDELFCLNHQQEKGCSNDQFACYKSKSLTCLPFAARCNGSVECPEHEDEKGCSSCRLEEFECSNGRCISSTRVCDGRPDCSDHSDESYDLCAHRYPLKLFNTSCDSKFTCKNGHCIDMSFVCDGKENCNDGSDEGGNCSQSCDQKGLHCAQKCQKNPTGPNCFCSDGYRLGEDGYSCVDHKECTFEPPVCSQICVEEVGSYKCDCYNGFKLRNDDVSCKSAEDRMNLIFVSNNTIYRLDEKNNLLEVLLSINRSVVTDLDISVRKSYVYFSIKSSGSLYRINLRNKAYEYITDLNQPQLISVEWISENVYYVGGNFNNFRIALCNFQKSVCVNIHDIPEGQIVTALKVDASNKLIFFATIDKGARKSMIYKSSLDGNNVQEIFVSSFERVTGLAYDSRKELLYCSDKSNGLIFKIKYNGNDQMTILRKLEKPNDLTIFDDYLYFSDKDNNDLQICQLFVNYQACLSHNINFKIQKFEILHTSRQPMDKKLCDNSTCPHLCIPLENSHTCVCENQQINCLHYEKIIVETISSKTFNGTFEENEDENEEEVVPDKLPTESRGASLYFTIIFTILIILFICGAAYYYLKKHALRFGSFEGSAIFNRTQSGDDTRCLDQTEFCNPIQN